MHLPTRPFCHYDCADKGKRKCPNYDADDSQSTCVSAELAGIAGGSTAAALACFACCVIAARRVVLARRRAAHAAAAAAAACDSAALAHKGADLAKAQYPEIPLVAGGEEAAEAGAPQAHEKQAYGDAPEVMSAPLGSRNKGPHSPNHRYARASGPPSLGLLGGAGRPDATWWAWATTPTWIRRAAAAEEEDAKSKQAKV